MRLTATLGIALALVALGPTVVGAAGGTKDKNSADWEPVPGYKYREIDGFHLLVNVKVLEEAAKSTDRRKPMEVLEMEMDFLVRLLPPKAVTALRVIPIWVEWDAGRGETAHAVACYHPGNTATQKYSYSSLESAVKANCVEIVNMRALCAEHQGKEHRCVMLHEFTHAVHHHLFGDNNPVIKAAYDSAMAKGLYSHRYASTNDHEYFAELSCAYFSHLNYPPRTREDLKKYDPPGYQVMEKLWGTPLEIEEAQRPEKEKNATLKLAAARRLLRDKKKQDEAISTLKSVGKEFPGTRAAKEAAKLLKKYDQGKEDGAPGKSEPDDSKPGHSPFFGFQAPGPADAVCRSA
jgi:hypothetical protein